jgi:hypothetical protein
MTRKIKRVEIEWFDSAAPIEENSQYEIDELLAWEPMRQSEVGYLIGENTKGDSYLLVGNMSEQGTCRHCRIIPRVNVKKIRYWKE